MSNETEYPDTFWIEWGVRRTRGDVGSIAFFERDYRTARNCAREWPGVLVSRTVTASEWTEAAPRPAPSEARQSAGGGEQHG